MSRLLTRSHFFGFFLSALCACSAAQVPSHAQPVASGLTSPVEASGFAVGFTSLDGTTALRAVYRLPNGQGPFPAIVFLHGCSGLGRNARISSRHTAWAEHMLDAGYAVLMIDSATPRGVQSTCNGGSMRRLMYMDRPKDAYAGLAFLQQQKNIRADKIGLLGWSQGGGITLRVIEQASSGRPTPPPDNVFKAGFKAAVAFYPGGCNTRAQTGWSTIIPLLVLHGSDDNWTKPAPCQQLARRAQQRSDPVEFVLYQGARHSFDFPNSPARTLTGITLADGSHPTVGTHPTAREDSMRRVPAFFARYLQ
ncbi:MAG: dienelactone hydrolase family protein [Burkholderiaceae bacterium]